ncbi:MAG: phosphate signaling complex protein PhoU [Acidimicrobiales bacterium]
MTEPAASEPLEPAELERRGRTQFQDALDTLKADVDALGSMAAAAVAGAVASLVGDDLASATRVVAGDDGIDAWFLALEERAYALLAQQAPVASDLRFLIAALRVMADYEKAGDRAVAVAKVALTEWEREPATLRLLGRMGDLTLCLLDSARRAWRDEDIVEARDLRRRDCELDACYRRLTEHLMGQVGEGATALAIHAHAAGRNLERIADHAVMIGDRVSYLVTGDPSALAAEIG